MAAGYVGLIHSVPPVPDFEFQFSFKGLYIRGLVGDHSTVVEHQLADQATACMINIVKTEMLL